MAQLKDTIISGNLRVTDTAIANTVQVTTIKAPTSSGGTSYGPGTSGQVLKSNGTSVYWTSDSNTDTKVDQVLNSDNKYRPLLMANAETSSTTATVNSSTIRNNSIYANASTGYIHANGFKSTSYCEFKHNTYPILVLEREGGPNAALIQFKNSNGSLGYIGMTGTADGGLVRINGATGPSIIIHDQDNTSGIGHYCTCPTAADTAAKVATVVSTDATFKLVTGVTVSVKFSNGNTYDGNATLNVNSTGAKTIQYRGGQNATIYYWSAGELIDFTYDGVAWVMHRSAPASTTFYGITKLTDSITTSNSNLAATATAVKTLNTNKLNNNTQTILYNAGHPTLNALTSAITLSATTFGVYKLLIIKYSDVSISNKVEIGTTYDFIIPCDYLKSLGTSGKYTAGSEAGIAAQSDGLILEARYLSNTSIGLHIMAGPNIEILDFSDTKVTILGVV